VKKRKARREIPKATAPTRSAPRPAVDDGEASSSNSTPSPDRSFPIVGVGASAGGLEAFTQLLEDLPRDTGMAFVLIQHLDPTHASFLSEALTKATRMPVTQAEDGQHVAPNHVYVIPPNADIGILHGLLTLLPRDDEARKPHLPIDFFFRALAADRGSQAIGVVLSGTASDGTEGLKAIKAENGITFAQDPKSAKFGGMPDSAVNAGVVDYSLALPELAAELARLSRHPYIAEHQRAPKRSDHATLNKIFVLVRNAVGVDFSEYKAATFERRLARRMALRQVEDLQKYLLILQREPDEAKSLYEDVLIHVTSFFRDPDLFEGMKARVFPEILKNKAESAPVRAWVAGCSTGEEVYSLAIALLEFMGGSRSHALQIFGTDVSETAIEKARAGVFGDSAMRDVSDERRRRFFTKVDNGYRITKTVRDLCVFVRHDLGRDPPFSKLDLVSCRNVLIYFDQPLQKRVLLTIHYSLNQPGFLVLGRTENISGFTQLFTPTDKSNKVFARTAIRSTLEFAPRLEIHPTVIDRSHVGFPEHPQRALDLGKHLDRMLVARFSPPGVLINDKMEILQFRGETGDYLQPAAGEPQTNLLKMARGGLLSELRTTIAEAKKKMRSATAEGVEVAVERDGSPRFCDIEVVPFTGLPDASDRLFIVMFKESTKTKRGKPARSKSTKAERSEDKGRVQKLEHELVATKEYLHSLVDDHGRTNDELNAANEELTSGNEELQSMNEELETAKEELQSTNEELTTVNEELHSRNQEVNQINSDLVNLLSTVDIPILILDMERRIRRFTPKARSILNVLPSDIGRSLDDIRINVEVPDLHDQITEVIETNLMRESEVQDRNARWYRLQIRPYKTTDNKIDGATLSLLDIDSLKHHIGEAEQAKSEAERANRTKDEFLATLSHELRTPLATMLMQSQMLRKTEDPKSKRAGEAIERATKTQVQLIDDLLDVSRIVAGKLRMELEAVDLGTVIRAAVEGVSAPAERKSIELKLFLDPSIGRVSGDPARLQQIVSNLLTNAVKFTPASGQVTLELDRVDGRARITVTDTGMGIDPGFLEHVFNRFSQEDGSNTRVYGGLGLGLAIVRHLVEAHGGTVTAQSAGTGKGATFSVTLPLMTPYQYGLEAAIDEVAIEPSPAVDAKLTVAARSGEPAPLKDLRVLVIDDDLGTREAVSEMLGRAGADVRVAESANEGMTVVEEFRPQVLLCDIAMPGEDGYSFIRKIRARGAAHGGNVPALALTALAGEEDRQRALQAGFQMHVAKPVDIARLTQAVVDLAQCVTAAARDSMPSRSSGG
jgi:chemotaxis methyl-accepting protein methylase/signal transduction histidine kinase/chemotaxis response regulator CheB